MRRSLYAATALLISLTLTTGGVAAASGRQALAVTFDDLPFVHIARFDEQRIRQQTHRLLNALTQAGVMTVGFVNEHKLYRQGEPDASRVALLQQWLDAGMELGNHTYAHLSLNAVGTADFEADILRGERIIRQLMEQSGKQLRYFRPPFLHVGRDLQSRREVERFLARHDYTIAPVTILSDEWLYAAAYDNALGRGDKALLARIGQAYLKHMGQSIEYAEALAGDMFGHNISQVLLLHANMLNADYFPALAEQIRQYNYRFAPLEEVLQDRAYRSLDTYTASAGDSWLHHWLLSVGMIPRSRPSCPDFVRQLAGASGYNSD
jgi:peptidoglycan/xylan/chitin deacetylase (PgdA/CDA1 family)